MRKQIELLTVALFTVSTAASCSKPPDGEGISEAKPVARGVDAAEERSTPLVVAVVTGGHPFDVPNFYRLFRELPGIDAYPQHLEHFASSPQAVRDSYDAVVFYGMDQGVPEEEGRRAAGNPKASIERLVEQGQGIVILHHALLAWEKWDFWNQLIGFNNRSFRYKEGLSLEIKGGDDKHAVTQGVSDFEIVDEGYVLHGDYDGSGTVLLTVDHEDAMHQVAWAREHGKSRVFCLTLGHDNAAWTNPGFREVLRRGIDWCAAR